MNIYKKVFDGKNIGEILYDEPMKNHTTFKIGGSCDVMIFPKNEEQIINAIQLIKQNDFAYRIIGNGSNLLVSDEGLREVVIKLHDNFNDMKIEGDILTAKSGSLLSAVSKLAINNSYAGFEAVSGIPGDIGGAITMNAGAYGTEMKDIVHRVKVIDTDLNVKYFNCDEMDFSYRHSRVQDEKLVVLEVEFLLKKVINKKSSIIFTITQKEEHQNNHWNFLHVALYSKGQKDILRDNWLMKQGLEDTDTMMQWLVKNTVDS